MATPASVIIQAAIDSSTANDGGASPIASNSTEMLGVLDRKIKQVYTLVALPRDKGGTSEGDFFKTTWTITVGDPGVLVDLPANPNIAFIDLVQDTAGNNVSIVPYRDVVDGIAEYPPAVILLDKQMRSCQRDGDPVAGDVLTIFGSYLPGTLATVNDFIGAITPGDANTSTWPSEAGDPFLVAYLGLYFAMKDGTRDGSEVQNYRDDMTSSAQTLADLLGVNASALVTTSDK
jgi:hypothetical protein